ncbi:MAG: class I SAM-dependent methyltransferase [Chloroflexota bacterium]|nr:class I SAM-dependent methyltransferase [Chloroflexota bacterium]
MCTSTPHPAIVLDVGCGPGTYHPALAAVGARLTACDPSAGMLRDAVLQAEQQQFDIDAARAGAEALPFADGVFDTVMANHMLYHVADQQRALTEMRRVLRIGGRAIMATNAAQNCARIDSVHDEAARSLGYTPLVPDALRFTLDDLALVRSVLPDAQVFVRDDAFIFPDAASAVRYYASYMIDAIEDRPADGSHRPRLAAEVHDRIQQVVQREGSFRVPKAAGCFVASRGDAALDPR